MEIKNNEEAEMSLINDYTHLTLTDQRERDFARLAEHNRQVRLAMSDRGSWWRRLQARRQERISIAAQHSTQQSSQRGMATPQHRVAH
jgi:rhamnose utilization protein RhaD (predicted bifunctional aldolase and dehydrogenase)